MFQLLMLISWLLEIYMWIIIAAAVISWINPDPYNPIVQLLRRVTEPVLRPIRQVLFQVLPPYRLGLDFSPLVAIFLIQIVRRVVLPALF